MAKQRKIKHYRYGYSSKRQRRSRFFKGLFFALLLALLVFLGYCGTRAVKNLMNRPKGPSEPTSQTESLPPESSDSSLPEESSEPDSSRSRPEREHDFSRCRFRLLRYCRQGAL